MLKKSISILNRNLIPVILVALISVFLHAVSSKSAIATFVSVGYYIAQCAVFGGLWQWHKRRQYNFIGQVNEHFWAFALSSIIGAAIYILIFLALAFMLVINANGMHAANAAEGIMNFYNTPGMVFLRFFTSCIFIMFLFVYPFIFVAGKNGFAAVGESVKFLFRNFKSVQVAVSTAFISLVISHAISFVSLLYKDVIVGIWGLGIVLGLVVPVIQRYLTFLCYLISCFTLEKRLKD